MGGRSTGEAANRSRVPGCGRASQHPNRRPEGRDSRRRVVAESGSEAGPPAPKQRSWWAGRVGWAVTGPIHRGVGSMIHQCGSCASLGRPLTTTLMDLGEEFRQRRRSKDAQRADTPWNPTHSVQRSSASPIPPSASRLPARSGRPDEPVCRTRSERPDEPVAAHEVSAQTNRLPRTK